MRHTTDTPKQEAVTICGWCPGARELTQKLADAGYQVSHGMCPACTVKMMAELDAKGAK